MSNIHASEKIVRSFLEVVRAGKEPERAAQFMSDTIFAHQMNSENQQTIKRTPQDYANHIKEFIEIFGHYQFTITELIANNDKVYARWEQTGKHLQDIDGHRATGLPLIEIGSAVYKVVDGKICEYWIQLDRTGMEMQLLKNEKIKR